MSHVNIIMIYELCTLKLKMEYTKLFGEVVVYLIFLQCSENAKFLFLLICEGLFIFSYEDPSSLIPQSKVCSMLISLVYINLGHIKKVKQYISKNNLRNMKILIALALLFAVAVATPTTTVSYFSIFFIYLF